MIRDEFQVTSNALVKKQARRNHPSSGFVLKRAPHPAAWAKALELAEGDALRCVTVDPTTVVVYNSREKDRHA